MKWKIRLPRWKMSRRVWLWGGGLIAAMMLWMTAPLVMRRLAFFRVRQVELIGIRYLDADQVLGALRLGPQASVFDDTNLLVNRLLALDGVADAAITRRPPGSLKVIVREIQPVALAMSGRGSLEPVDEDGRALPFDVSSLDLPVVQGADSGVIGVLARIEALDPSLFQTIDAARRTTDERGDVVLEVGAHRVLLARDAGQEVLEAVTLVARDLKAKSRSYAELDGRYAGQVVVRRRGAKAA